MLMRNLVSIIELKIFLVSKSWNGGFLIVETIGNLLT